MSSIGDGRRPPWPRARGCFPGDAITSNVVRQRTAARVPAMMLARACSKAEKPENSNQFGSHCGDSRLGGRSMSRILFISIGAALLATMLSMPAQAQQRPQIETTKVDGTDNVYIFRNGNHQSMFVVTKDGVIATDPVAYGRPTGGKAYVDEIRKVTDKPIKYLIYSHHHYDHIAGGKAFKDAGARIIAHKNVRARLAPLGDPNTVLPDESFDGKKEIKLGGTTLELIYLGASHCDSNIVLRLPKEKIIFVVDTIPVGS